jgi:histidinol-phosphate aminotransferase
MTELTYKPNIEKISTYKAGQSTIAGFDKIIKLSSNESPYGASPSAIQAYHDAGEFLYKYPDGGITDLTAAIANAHSLDISRIVCGSGSDNILELLCTAFAGTDDEVIFSQKSFPIYRIATLTAGATPVEIPYTDDYAHNIDAMIKAITPKTKLIFIATPDNPTGRYVSKSDIQRLIQATPKNCLLVIDEAYVEYVDSDDYKNGLEFTHEYQNVAVTRTFSKLFGLASLRVGWGYMPLVAAEALRKIRSPFNVSLPAQKVAIAALNDTSWSLDKIAKNNHERQKMIDYYQLSGIKFIPSQANFICLIRSDVSKMDNFLKSKGIIVRNMAGNGSPELLRISIGTQEQNKQLQMALSEYLTCL